MTTDNGEAAGIGILLGAFADLGDKQDKLSRQIANDYKTPLHPGAYGTAITDGSSPFPVFCTSRTPATGRVWNVRSIGVYSKDAHTPVYATAPTISVEGQVTNPALGGVIAQISGAALNAIAPPGSTWQVAWSVGLSGTVTAADANNMALTTPLNTVKEQGVFPGAVGQYGQITTEVSPAAGVGINVQASPAAASGAAAVYNAEITATALNPIGVDCEMFVGDFPDAGGSTFPIQGVLLDNVGPNGNLNGLTVPCFVTLARHAIWCEHGETVYALIYGAPAGTQLVIVTNVEEYELSAVEGLRI